ncbi:unnamed protein product [Brassica napus]|uniref:(rape) hypothetical protein n=1 Tax=Brassica napus TaxID=3708 RepID=A0A816UYK8_BRANA|nr:unnamed protein product [Brassica napus]
MLFTNYYLNHFGKHVNHNNDGIVLVERAVAVDFLVYKLSLAKACYNL